MSVKSRLREWITEMTDLKILGIDTSGKTASVALYDGERILGEITYITKLTHSQIILPLVKELLSRLETELCNVDCIAVSEGPGSYTGLRIGVAAVKGMCFDGKTKCCGISTLESIANNLGVFEGVAAVVMHARPNVAYFGAYRCENGGVSAVFEDKVCGYGEISEYISGLEGKVILAGDICEKIKEELFSNLENVAVAPPSLKLQRASSLCELAAKRADKWTSADELNARYLQETKAEKDRRFS